MSSNIIDIKTNFPEVKKQLDLVSDGIGKKAMVRAMNLTMTQGKAEMARDISKEFNITVTKVKKRLQVTKARPDVGEYRFEATLEATKRDKERSMNVIAFVGARPKRTKKGKLAQVKFQIKRSGGKKILRGAFVANENRTLFIRTGDERLPIVPVNTIGIPQMFNTTRINEIVRSVMVSRFEKNFNRELRVVLGGFLK